MSTPNDSQTEKARGGSPAPTGYAFDDLFTITCGHCKKTHPVLQWCHVHGYGLPVGEFECPGCGYAFRRQARPNAKWPDTFVELVTIKSRRNTHNAAMSDAERKP